MFPFRAVFFCIFLIVLGLVVWCSSASSPDMREIPVLPDFLAAWANANPTFRNFPAFGLLSVLLVFVGNLRRGTSEVRGLIASTLAAAAAVSAAGAVLECLQLALPGRFFDPMDIFWSVLGAVAGSFAGFACLISMRFFHRNG
jgi:glycopeptide antibiotics resistance protein